jgi:hypothetical protein
VQPGGEGFVFAGIGDEDVVHDRHRFRYVQVSLNLLITN